MGYKKLVWFIMCVSGCDLVQSTDLILQDNRNQVRKKTSQDAQLVVERAPIHLMDKCEFAECSIPLSQVVEMIKFVPKSAKYQDS